VVDGTLKWTAAGATTTSETDDFAADRVFLVVKVDTDKSGVVEIVSEHVRTS
jgi:hypothetical protein